jgi:multisubunit Na+/H+ antiporter MnhC subunit
MTNQLEAAVLIAVLFGSGVFLCLSRKMLGMLFGFLLVSNAANLVLLAISGDPTRKSAAAGIDPHGDRDRLRGGGLSHGVDLPTLHGPRDRERDDAL